jgi:hypothetical protein
MLTIALALALVLCGFLVNKPAEVQVKEVQVPYVVEKVVKANSTLVDEMASDYLQDKYDEKSQNETAKSLVVAEKDERSFLKAVLAVLEDEGKSVEDYKDLTIYSFKIDDVELSEDAAEVSVTLKVSGFEDGDEESDFKARIGAVFYVSNLDVDELSEAEVEDYEFTFEKFYD